MKRLPIIQSFLPGRIRAGVPSVPVSPGAEGATGRETADLAGLSRRLPTPFEVYRRRKLLRTLGLFRLVSGKSLLDVCCTDGDLLALAGAYQAKELFGVVAGGEASLARISDRLAGLPVDLVSAQIPDLPFPDQAFDVVLSVEPTDHRSVAEPSEEAMSEWCRVSRQWVLVAVPVGSVACGGEAEGPAARTLQWYEDHFRSYDFQLRSMERLRVAVSARVFAGRSNPWHWGRWLLSPILYLLGFPRAWLRPPVGGSDLPSSALALYLQRQLLPLTGWLDKRSRGEEGGTVVLRFERRQLFRRF